MKILMIYNNFFSLVIVFTFLLFGCQSSNDNIFITGYKEGTFWVWKFILYKDYSFICSSEFIGTTSITGKWERTATNDIRLNCFNEKSSTYCECGIIDINPFSYPYDFKMTESCDTNYLYDVERLDMTFFVIDTAYFSRIFPNQKIEF